MGGVAEQHRQEMARLLDLLPAEVSRVRGPGVGRSDDDDGAGP